MNRLARALASAAAGLARHPFALVGGIAVSARVEPRFTRDLDIAVAVADDAGAEAVVREMIARRFRLTTVIEQPATDRLATVRLGAPDETEPGIVVDLLFASSGIEPGTPPAQTGWRCLPESRPLSRRADTSSP